MYPGGPATFPVAHDHIWNGDFKYADGGAPLGWVKDPKLAWQVSSSGLQLTGAAQTGVAGIVQRYETAD